MSNKNQNVCKEDLNTWLTNRSINRIDKSYLYENTYLKDNQTLRKNRKLENKIFKKLFKKLNKIHGISLNQRHWKILINHWLRFIINNISLRKDYLNYLIHKKKKTKFIFNFNKKNITAPYSLEDYYSKIENKDVNNYICCKIALYIKNKTKIKVEINYNKKISKVNFINSYYNHISIKKIFIRILNFFLKFLIKNNSPIIISSYLPRAAEHALQIKNHCFFFWKNYFDLQNYEILRKIKIINILFRKKIFNSRKKNISYENLVTSLINDFFPTLYYENFKILNNFSQKKNIIKKIKYIFTSNEFLFNDFFKIYLVNNLILNKNLKYYVGQHGSNYNVVKENKDACEIITCDKFLTWGWKAKNNDFPAGNFKTIGMSAKPNPNLFNSIQTIVIINPNLDIHQDSNDEKKKYIKNLFKVVKFIQLFKKNKIKIEIIYRFHKEDKFIFNDVTNLLLRYCKSIKFDFGNVNFNKYKKNNTIIIFNYYSTGFLELMSVNHLSFVLLDLNKNLYNSSFYTDINSIKNIVVFDDVNKLYDKILNLINCNNKSTVNQIINDKKYVFFKNKYSNYIKSINTLPKFLFS
jgi:putative transferase (TIGR04331 family)